MDILFWGRIQANIEPPGILEGDSWIFHSSRKQDE